MQRFIRKAHRGQMGAYLQFFVLLLLASMMLLVAMSISGCSSCDEDSYDELIAALKHESIVAEGLAPTVVGPGRVPPGGTLNLQVFPAQGAGARDLTWTPPPEATNFQFLGTAQPEPGGPPFVFEGVGDLADVRMSYTAPSEEKVLQDVVMARYSDGSVGGVAIETVVTSTASAAGPRAQAERPLLPARPLAQGKPWDVTYQLTRPGLTLTTGLCQEWVAKLQGDEFFLAARMPMTTTAITASYRLPFVFGVPAPQTFLRLEQYLPVAGPILTATLEYRPERFTFLANELPSAPGERWAALGLSAAEPLGCPAGLNVAPDDWGLAGNFLLDLRDRPDGCQGCTVLVYGCYEGQGAPWEALGQRMLSRLLGVESYQGQGVTCIGPKPVHLEEPFAPTLHLRGSAAAAITPTRAISLSNEVWGPGYLITVTMDYTSTVGGWQFYGGDDSGPDLGAQLTPNATEIVLPNAFMLRYIWAVNNPAPADTEAGPHSLVITVTSTTSPSLTTWDAIPLWSGDWVAPPPAGTKYRVYLPLVIKSP